MAATFDLRSASAAPGEVVTISAANPLPVALPAGTDTLGATRDAGPAWTQVRGTIASADLTTAADLTAAPTAGQKVVVDDLVLSADTAMRVDVLEETSGTVIASVYLTAGGVSQVTTRGKLKLDTANKKARLQASAAGNLRALCLYHSE